MMMVVLFLILFSFFSKTLYLIFCCVIVAIISIWIIHDTQLIIGSNHKYYRENELGLDDYVLGAIIIYSDIVMAFMYLT